MTTRLDKSGHGSVPHEVTDAIIDALGGKSPPTVSSVTFREQAGPDTPPPGSDALFFDSADGSPKYVDDTGTVNTFGGGGAATVKHVVVPITFADISAVTGFANVYLLPDNETVVASWPVMTAAFNGTYLTFPFTGAQLGGASGAGGASMGDPFDATTTSTAVDGLIGPDPTSGPGATVTKMFPIGAPVPGGGSVQLSLDFTGSGGGTTVPGTTGALDYHLLIAFG